MVDVNRGEPKQTAGYSTANPVMKTGITSDSKIVSKPAYDPVNVSFSRQMKNYPSVLQRSRFAHLIHRHDVSCIFHALTIQTVYGGHLLDDLFEAFAEATPVEQAINRLSANHSYATVNRAMADLLRNGILVEGTDEDVRLYKSLYRKGVNMYRIQHMYILPTAACNFRCKYCFVEDDSRHLNPCYMDTTTAELAATVFAKLSKESEKPSVTFYGGEPLLNPKATFSALRSLRRIEAEGEFLKGVRISIVTNGSLIDAEAISVFRETKPAISVSIDGPKMLHDTFRVDKYGKGTFDAALAGYKNLQDAGLKPGISCTLNGSTIGHIEEIVDFIIKDIKPNGMGFNLLLPQINGKPPSPTFDYKFAVQQLIKAFRRLREAGIYEDRMMRRVRPYTTRQLHFKDCMGVGGQIVVTPEGRVGPCQAYLGVDDNKYFPLDVRELATNGDMLSSAVIYKEPLFNEWRHRFPLNMSECADCFAISICGGGCPYAAAVTDGSIWKIDERVCCQAKDIFEWMIWDTYDHMSKELSTNNQKEHREISVHLPNGETSTILVNPHIMKRDLAKHNPGTGTMEGWFRTKFYDDLSDIRRESQGYYKHYVHNFVTNFFSKEKVAGKRVLDFGCGPGFYSAILAQCGANVVGIDKSKFLIDKANEHKARLGLKNVEFIQADLTAYASHWDPCSFDYVIAIDTVVSFDYCSRTHNHEEVLAAFRSVSRLLKGDGRFFIIESHPFFGQVLREITSDTGEYFCIRPSGYKIEYKLESDPHHWFTLDEMTRAISESGLAVLRIHEPDPSIALKQEDSKSYAFRLKYPGSIVYEICKIRV